MRKRVDVERMRRYQERTVGDSRTPVEALVPGSPEWWAAVSAAIDGASKCFAARLAEFNRTFAWADS